MLCTVPGTRSSTLTASRSWMVKLDVKPGGGMALDPKFLLEFEHLRAHQVRLEGGDASSGSYCYS